MLKKTVWSAWVAIVAILVWCFALQLPVSAENRVHSPAALQHLASDRITSGFQEDRRQARVEIARIRSGVLPGVVVGGHYAGLLKILQNHYIAAGQLSEQLEDASRSLLEEELSQAGYEVASSLFNTVFEDQLTAESEPGRFLIGGTITQVRLNSYSSLWGDRTTDERRIRWEVFDREVGKVVYRRETIGSATAEGVDSPAATYDAIRASFQALLAEPDLITTLALPSQAESFLVPTAFQIPAIASSRQALSVEDIAGRAIPSIVRIRTSSGRGSGFLIDNTGLVMTNQHVVGSAYTVKVDLYDGSVRNGRVLKRDAVTDVALVKLEGGTVDIPGLPICQTNAVKVGEAVVVIGNPLSFANSVSQGIVSGIRSIATRSLIQTDAAVNPGNSGGPLLNRHGVVVGIVTEKVASRGIEGLGFALPIEESLQKLNVKVNTPTRSALDACGNPTV